MALQLIPVCESGEVPGCDRDVSDFADVLQATVALYRSVGFVEPWIGYLGTEHGEIVGTCGFKSPPVEGRVEIAYFTFPRFEGRGFATAMAAQLIALARDADDSVLVAAQTLPDRNASHRILEKLGFESAGEIEHPVDGTVLEWHLAAQSTEDGVRLRS